MRILRICSFLLVIFLVVMLCCYSPTAQPYESNPIANFSTLWKLQSEDQQPMLVRKTNVSQFACGFVCSYEDNCTSFLFSIRTFGNNDEFGSSAELIWSVSPDYLVKKNGTMNFTAAGDLVLKDADGRIVWTTNTAGKSVVGMNLTDTGNLVLFDHQNSVVWQSFDHPIDCLLPGQKLFAGQKLISRDSLNNYLTGKKGMYYLQVKDDGLVAYVESNPPQIYYRKLINSHNTIEGRRYIEWVNGSLFLSVYSTKLSYNSVVLNDILPATASSAQFMRLMPDGHLQVFELKDQMWTKVKDLTVDVGVDECSYPLACGKYSVCSSPHQCSCPRPDYFRAVDSRQPNLGCYEITPLTCNSTLDQDLIELDKIEYFTVYNSIPALDWVSLETCKQACLNNCSCKAAVFRYHLNASTGSCYLPFEIFTMQDTPPENIDVSFFIKVQKVKSSPSSHDQVAIVVGSTIGSIVLLLVVVIGFITYVVQKRKRDAEMEEVCLDQVPGMPNRFSHQELITATDNFSKKLGEGGFGSVFEGSLKDDSKIAVKCLEGRAHVKKSFLAEVQSIGNIHHVNLVRLRGFCTWKSQHFLVYDFMSNGSLDKWIYHGNREHVLSWERRKKIIVDIAKGLAYLHEDCRQKIVHLDIKPQNILLDNDFNAKVSDFGLSKLIDKNQSEVMTTIKGTPGYLAPEWRSSVITEKVDVYSFGIVLLEILCGRKVFDRSQPEESGHLLNVFQECWEQGTLLDMVDSHSEDMQAHSAEVVEMMKVSSWCLQTNFKRRPSMSSVVKVLEGGMNVESNLDYNFIDPIIQETQDGDERCYTQFSASLLSGPR